MARLAGGRRHRGARADQVAPEAVLWYALQCFVLAVCWTLRTEAPWSDLTSSPNTHVVPFDAAFPGTLPVMLPPKTVLHCPTDSACDSV